ncbi:hypothetical protein ACFFGT_25840 [Mucilaginibacter angelicae]|uniref:Uncharacterized protein n=1 Tax=Mucilaginibacter angelicae TaxID=869718 RepID=A0ABV6LDX1_9SPHI
MTVVFYAVVGVVTNNHRIGHQLDGVKLLVTTPTTASLNIQ